MSPIILISPGFIPVNYLIEDEGFYVDKVLYKFVGFQLTFCHLNSLI